MPGAEQDPQAAPEGLYNRMMSPLWENTRRELDLWAAQGLKAVFWVRDDDAFETSAQLARLHDLAVGHDITIGLAVIPAKLHPSLPLYMGKDGRRFHPMCHGWQHINHAGSGSKPAEFGRQRPVSALVNDARLAYRTFSDYFGEMNVVFVPPFGRISRTLVRALPEIGYTGISGAAGWLERKLSLLSDWNIRIPTVEPSCWSSIPRLDVQIDPIDWRNRTAHDPATIGQSLVRCLRARRSGLLASNLPIGLVTHHLAHDENVWQACDAVLQLLRRHEAIEFLHVGQFFKGIAEAAH
jgi:hypothetical protein